MAAASMPTELRKKQLKWLAAVMRMTAVGADADAECRSAMSMSHPRPLSPLQLCIIFGTPASEGICTLFRLSLVYITIRWRRWGWVRSVPMLSAERNSLSHPRTSSPPLQLCRNINHFYHVDVRRDPSIVHCFVFWEQRVESEVGIGDRGWSKEVVVLT